MESPNLKKASFKTDFMFPWNLFPTIARGLDLGSPGSIPGQ